MDKTTNKKKIRFILIAFCILIIPIGYLAAISYAIKIHNNALELAQIKYPSDLNVTQKSIKEIDKAIKIYPWNYLFYMNKAQLQMKLKNYGEALISARNGTEKNNQYAEGLEFQGLIYEYLGQLDSAKNLYSKAIDKYKIRLSENPDNQLTNRKIALLYTIIGDTNNSKAYLTDIYETSEYYDKEMIERYDFYIENYKSGGLRDFLSNESIDMVNDSITDDYELDSLIHSLRIYSNGHTTIVGTNQEKELIYKFRDVFKEKAELNRLKNRLRKPYTIKKNGCKEQIAYICSKLIKTFNGMNIVNEDPKSKEKGDGSVVAGVILIVLGILFLIERYIDIDFRDLWPFLLITVGVLIIWRGKRN